MCVCVCVYMFVCVGGGGSYRCVEAISVYVSRGEVKILPFTIKTARTRSSQSFPEVMRRWRRDGHTFGWSGNWKSILRYEDELQRLAAEELGEASELEMIVSVTFDASQIA